MTPKVPTPLLIADPDAEYTLNLKLDPRAKAVPPVVTTSARETEALLMKSGADYSAILLNPDLAPGGVAALLRRASQSFPHAPVFYLTDRVNVRRAENGVESEVVRKVIRKPVSYAELIKTVQLFSDIFDPEEALKLSNNDPLNVEIAAKDTAFKRIRAAHFITGGTSLFDIYLQREPGRFEKILQAGSPGVIHRSENSAKNVASFFLRQEAAECYLKYCDRLSAVLVRKPGIPAALKIGFLFNHGDEVLRFIRTQGLNEVSVGYARRFVEYARDFAGRIHELPPAALLGLFLSAADVHREVAAVLMGMLLIHKMRFQSDKSFEIVGLATLLNQVGLQNDERGEIDQSIFQAVEAHHERQRPEASALKITAKFNSGLSEVVGVSDLFSKFLFLPEGESRLRAFAHGRLPPIFSAAVQEAFFGLFGREENREQKI